MRKRETNLTLEFTREVVAGAQMLIAAKYSQLRSGKSVRESKAALKRWFFFMSWQKRAHMKYEILLQLSRELPSFFYNLRIA